MTDSHWIAAAPLADLREGDVVAARVAGREIALYLVEGAPFASDDRCTHGAARLSEGFLIDHCIECPLHQGQFDIRSGEPMCAPVTEPLRTYRARIVDGMVELAIGTGA
jgi:naphthalene 1,2-dioxygenase system ferredoxin subunit